MPRHCKLHGTHTAQYGTATVTEARESKPAAASWIDVEVFIVIVFCYSRTQTDSLSLLVFSERYTEIHKSSERRVVRNAADVDEKLGSK